MNALKLFRSGIAKGSHHFLIFNEGRIRSHFCNTKISQFRLIFTCKQNIVGLDITVNDAVGMSMLQGAGELNGNSDDLSFL